MMFVRGSGDVLRRRRAVLGPRQRLRWRRYDRASPSGFARRQYTFIRRAPGFSKGSVMYNAAGKRLRAMDLLTPSAVVYALDRRFADERSGQEDSR